MVPLIRELLPAEIRQRLNKLAAEQLRARGASDLVLAHHETEAASYERAIHQLERAGETALRSNDPAGAIESFRTAVDVARWKMLSAEHDPEYVKLNSRLGQAMHAAGDARGAHVVLRYAESYSDSDPKLASQIRRLLAKALVEQGRPVRAVETLKKAIGDAIVDGDIDLLSEMYLELGELLVRSNDTAQALKELDEGMDLVTLGQGPSATNGARLLWKMLLRMAEYRYRLREAPDLSKAVELTTAALTQAHRIQNSHGVAESHLLLGELLREAGDLHQSQHHYASALETLRQTGDRRALARCLLAASDHASSTNPPNEFRQQAYQLAWEVGWTEGMRKAGQPRTNAS